MDLKQGFVRAAGDDVDLVIQCQRYEVILEFSFCLRRRSQQSAGIKGVDIGKFRTSQSVSLPGVANARIISWRSIMDGMSTKAPRSNIPCNAAPAGACVSAEPLVKEKRFLPNKALYLESRLRDSIFQATSS